MAALLLTRKTAENKENALTPNRTEIKRLREKLAEIQANERRLLNENQQLKGNIRTFVRVRPLLKFDAVKDSDVLPMSIQTKDMLAIDVPQQSTSAAKKTKTVNFRFNRVFGMTATQNDVFQEVKEVVQSTLEGYNVSIISYGQTGSGKTHTMQGDGTKDGAGLIPRSLNSILCQTAAMKKLGWEFTIDLTFLEIYNETIQDLLWDFSLTDKKTTEPEPSHKIVSDKSRGLYVTNMNHVQIEGLPKAQRVLAHAQSKRSVCKTNLNDQSSRSHSIFSLTVHGVNKKAQKEVRGSLHLCDLAGSERVRRSKVEGVALQEAKAINKSLSQLSTVMQAIKRKEKHVPYRDSKLTRMLQDCLCNAGKTVFMVNVAPTPVSCQETHNSLVFANTVSQCELGKAEACVRRFALAEARERQNHRNTARQQKAAAAAAAAAAADAQSPPKATRRPGRPPMTPASSRKVKRQLFTPNEKVLQQQLDEQKALTETKVMTARETVMTEMRSIVKRNVSEVQRRHEEEVAELERMHAQQIARMEQRYEELKARLTHQLRLKQSQIDELSVELEELKDESEDETEGSDDE